MRPRLKPGTVKPFKFNLSIFLDSPYILFVLGMRLFLPLIWSDNLSLDLDLFFNDFANTAMTFLFASVYIPYFYLDYTTRQIADPRVALYLLSVMNAASFFGRILPGWLADW